MTVKKRTAASLAAIAALALCVLAASFATDTPFFGGSVLGTIIVVCLARNILRRWTGHGRTEQSGMGRGHAIVVSSRPLSSIADQEHENRECTVIDVEVQESRERVARWLEDAPSHLRAMREILDDYDRLQQEVSRLQAEVERYRHDRDEIAVALTEFIRGMDCLQRTLEQFHGETPASARMEVLTG